MDFCQDYLDGSFNNAYDLQTKADILSDGFDTKEFAAGEPHPVVKQIIDAWLASKDLDRESGEDTDNENPPKEESQRNDDATTEDDSDSGV